MKKIAVVISLVSALNAQAYTSVINQNDFGNIYGSVNRGNIYNVQTGSMINTSIPEPGKSTSAYDLNSGRLIQVRTDIHGNTSTWDTTDPNAEY
jgi:hypothetical protein